MVRDFVAWLDSKPYGFRGAFAQKAGIAPSTLSNICSGHHKCSRAMAEKIVAASDGELTLSIFGFTKESTDATQEKV